MFAYALASKPCSEATNIGDRLSLRAVLWLGMKLLFIIEVIWGIAERLWSPVKVIFQDALALFASIRQISWKIWGRRQGK